MATASTEQTPFVAGKKIIVSGAGISGLAFAIALDKQWSSLSPKLPRPSISIYERDIENAGALREGYSMSIRSDGISSGMGTLRKLGLLDSTLAASITGSQENPGNFTLWDKDWKVIIRARVDNKDLPVPHMRIARSVLKKQLLDAVEERNIPIHWETTCIRASKLSDGRISVQLGGGKIEVCDLLIVADGVRSKIRETLKPQEKLKFAGAVQIIGNAVFDVGNIPSPADRDWGLYLNESGSGLFISPIDDNRAIWSISHLSKKPRPVPKQPMKEEEFNEIMKEMRERGKSFKEPFLTLINATDPSTLRINNAFDKQPFGHDAKDGHIAYIGDSNHPVSPFAGNGANLAMMDAWDLAEQLCRHETFGEAMKAYDALAMPRAKSVIQFSHRTISLSHATGWKLFFFTWILRFINKFRGW